MADTKIDKSLDEIIKENKGSRGGMRRGGANGTRGAPARGARGGRFGRGSTNRGGFGRRPNTGAIQKRRSGGAGGLNGSPNKAVAAAAAVRY